MSDPTVRHPPSSIDAEQSVIGGLLIDNRYWPDVAELLTSADFYRHQHQVIFEVMAAMLDHNEPADMVTLSNRLRDRQLADAADLTYLGTLASDTPSAANTVAYARQVRECSIRRQVIVAGAAVGDAGWKAASAEEATDAAQKAVMGIGEVSQAEMPLDISEHMDSWERQLERRHRGEFDPTIKWGLKDLDAATGGVRPGDLCFVLGRPGMGKTALAMNLADRAAMRGEASLFFSMEMPTNQLIDRVMSGRADIPFERLRDPQKLNDADFDALARVRGGVRDIVIDDRGGLNINQIRARARRVARSKKLSLLVIDYFQLIRGCGQENRNLELENAAIGLKELGKELGFAVVVPTQVSRDVERRENKRPRPSDAKDCGGIEQAADLIVGLYRDHYYNTGAPPNVAEAIICKQRNGPQGVKVRICWRGEYCRFDDLAHYDFDDSTPPPQARKGLRAPE
jgi:replicative DNA helicase